MRISKYYRKITALIPHKHLLLYFVFFLSLSFLTLFSFFVLELWLYSQQNALQSQEIKKLSDAEKQLMINPNYPSLYMVAAIAAQRVGEHNKALFYATQAYKLDPLNQEVIQLKQSLEN